jgi:hypothetical protein
MSPAIEGVAARTPGRQNQSAVRLSLANSFQQEFADEQKGDKVKEPGTPEDGWEQQANRLGTQILDLDLQYKVNQQRLTKPQGVEGELVMPPSDEPSTIRAALANMLTEYAEGYGQDEGPNVDDTIDEIADLLLMESKRQLKQVVAAQQEWHTGTCETITGTLSALCDTVAADLSRVGGVITQHGGGIETDDEQSREATAQFQTDTLKINAAAHAVVTAIAELEGMKAVRAKQATDLGNATWAKGAELTNDQIEALTGKNDLEKALDVKIKDQEDLVLRLKVARGQVAINILGGGTASMRDTRQVTTAIKKLAAAKIDFSKGADTKTASMIRVTSAQIVKENYQVLWKLAPVIRMLASTNLIGKDFYIMKNNDLTKDDDESRDVWVKRLFDHGFRAIASDTADDGDPVGHSTRNELTQMSTQVADFVAANGILYDMLNADMPDQISAACDQSGQLFGETMHDSRMNSAARGDALANIEAWIFASERFGDQAHEAAADMVKHGAGWLVQDNWQGGIVQLRKAVLAAIDLRVEVTWAGSINKYMNLLNRHRPWIALQLKDEYGSPPKAKNSNVIQDIAFFLGKMKMLMQGASVEDKGLNKESKDNRRHRATYVSRSHNYAYGVSEPGDDWDEIDPAYLPSAMFTSFTNTSGKKSGKDAATDGKWKMLKHDCFTFNKEGRRCCDNQTCSNELSQSEFKEAMKRQRIKDEKCAEKGWNILPVWHQCGDCHKSDSDIVMPDGYMPKAGKSDESRATTKWKQSKTDKPRPNANAATVTKKKGKKKRKKGKSAESSDGEDDDTESLMSLQSAAESAKDELISKQADELKELNDKINFAEVKEEEDRLATLESKFNKLYATMQSQDEDPPQRSLRGRGHSSYQGLRQDER